jgi:ribonuclease HI
MSKSKKSESKLEENTSSIDYYVYTDGACSDNGMKNALAGLGIFFGEGDKRNVSAKVIGKQSNNVAELEAIYQTYALIENDLKLGKTIGIVSDSVYALGCITSYGKTQENGFWKKDIPNKELVKKTYLLYKGKHDQVKFINVKAHTDGTDIHSVGNSGADILANLAIGLTECPYASASDRIYLNVPFSKKDEVKSKGAKWDSDKKKWYITGSTIGLEAYL